MIFFLITLLILIGLSFQNFFFKENIRAILKFLPALQSDLGFPVGSDSKESACDAGDLGLIPGLGRSLEEGMATHSSIPACRIPVDRGAWWATVHGVPKSGTQTEQLNTAQRDLDFFFFFAFHFLLITFNYLSVRDRGCIFIV